MVNSFAVEIVLEIIEEAMEKYKHKNHLKVIMANYHPGVTSIDKALTEIKEYAYELGQVYAEEIGVPPEYINGWDDSSEGDDDYYTHGFNFGDTPFD